MITLDNEFYTLSLRPYGLIWTFVQWFQKLYLPRVITRR